MKTVTLIFPSSKPKGRNGIALPESCDIPIEDACQKDQMVELLESALETLAGIPCAFWACEGPTKPQHMVTCSKCWAMIDIAKVKSALNGF